MTNTRSRTTWSERWRKMDVFGSKIELTYKGDHQYKTRFGATMTFLVGIMVASYATFGFTDLLNHKIESISVVNNFEDVNIVEGFDPSKYGFKFAWGFSGFEMEPRIGKFELVHRTRENGENTSVV